MKTTRLQGEVTRLWWGGKKFCNPARPEAIVAVFLLWRLAFAARAHTTRIMAEDGRPAWMSRSNISRPMDAGFGGDAGLPECGDFKRGACFRATCKFQHNGRPASEYSANKDPNSASNGAAGLPTPKAAGTFVAPDHLDHNLYDPNTGFGLFGTPVFGTRYGMVGNLPKIDNVRPLCMDFFKQGFCNRRGPHNQGCLFRHDEVEGKGKIDDSGMIMRVTQTQVDVFEVEAQGRVGILSGRSGASDVAAAAVAYAKRRETDLEAQAAHEKDMEARKEAEAAAAAEAAERGKAAAEAAAAAAAANPQPEGAAAADGAAASAAPLPAGWKETKAPDGRFYYYHAATKKTQWTRPKAEEGANGAAAAAPPEPLPAGWKEAKAPDGRTYYFAPGEKTRWSRPTEPVGASAPAAAPAPVDAAAPADAAEATGAAAGEDATDGGEGADAADADGEPTAKRARVEE